MAFRLLRNLNAKHSLRVRLNIGPWGTEWTVPVISHNFSSLSSQTCRTVRLKTDPQNYNRQCYPPKNGVFSSSTVFSKFTTSSKYYQFEDYYKNENGYLIYVGESGFSIKVALSSMYTISGIVIAMTPTLMQRVGEHAYLPAMTMMMTFFLGVLNPAMFYLFCQRYVHELYLNNETDTYTALVPSPFVFGHKKIKFAPKECSMPARMTLFSSFLVRGKPLFINSDMMDYSDYSRMLRKAKEFDYENPDRQSQYQASVESSLKRLKESKKDN